MPIDVGRLHTTFEKSETDYIYYSLTEPGVTEGDYYVGHSDV